MIEGRKIIGAKKLGKLIFNNLFKRSLPLIYLLIFGLFNDMFAQKDGTSVSA